MTASCETCRHGEFDTGTFSERRERLGYGECHRIENYSNNTEEPAYMSGYSQASFIVTKGFGCVLHEARE